MAWFEKGNWGLKALSLILAVILWIYVSNELNPLKEQEFKAVPVEVRGAGPNLTVSLTPNSLNVRVQANESILAELSPRSIEVFVNVSQAKPGKTAVPVQVKVPAGVKVSDLRPGQVTVNLEPLTEKQVPVKIRTTNAPAQGYKVLAIKMKPEEVILKGPKNILDKVAFCSVDVDLKGRSKSSGETVPVKIGSETGNSLEKTTVKITPSLIELLVSIVPEMPSKTVPVIPHLNGQPAAGYTIIMTIVEPPELTITGDLALLNTISQVSTKPVEINGAQGDVYTDAAPELPSGVTADRQALQVLVKIEPR